jgi:hypothetical protein
MVKSDETASNGVILSSNITAIITEEIGCDTDDLFDGTVSSHRGRVDHLLFNNLWVLVVIN